MSAWYAMRTSTFAYKVYVYSLDSAAVGIEKNGDAHLIILDCLESDIDSLSIGREIRSHDSGFLVLISEKVEWGTNLSARRGNPNPARR